ncbi:ATP-binding protein [Imhoffiella purpurea]|uniref:Mobile element protein n=1 Tax=Imhoffiella purpurea TaxID=1249627 RepID=W9VVL9_9GAMM|nr:ATP-binding protein [Imhoffiella purpurea]EXJ14465.1 Mobile element protein [Imhoffiella purpurea]
MRKIHEILRLRWGAQLSLRAFRFLEERTNLVFIGPPGVGKTHLAIGIGLKALHAGYKVLFFTALVLVETLELAEMKGDLKKKIASLLKFDLLIIDELGYLPMNRQGLYNRFPQHSEFGM